MNKQFSAVHFFRFKHRIALALILIGVCSLIKILLGSN